MSIAAARQKRAALYLSICGLLLMVAAVSAVSARDPSGVSLRVGMVLMTLGAALWLPLPALLPAALVIWLAPNAARSFMEDEALFGTNMMLELPGLLGLAAFASLVRRALKSLEEETLLLGALGDELGIDAETGVYEARLLRPSLDGELVRSRRFGRDFALVLVGIDPLRQKFDYRNEAVWQASFAATAQLLKTTRAYDRVFRYEASGFAVLLPEAGPREVIGLVSRLRGAARRQKPAEGEPGGPLPIQFGATFFPQCATTTDDLIRRAEVALRIADRNIDRLQLDSAEAPSPPAPETLRRALAASQAHAAAMEAPGAGSAATAGAGAAASNVDISGLLQHLDETLQMIRSLRSNRAA